MSQIEVSKVNAFIATGLPDGITASKVVCYLLLYPGESGEDTSRNVSVFSNIQRKPD